MLKTSGDQPFLDVKHQSHYSFTYLCKPHMYPRQIIILDTHMPVYINNDGGTRVLEIGFVKMIVQTRILRKMSG